MAPLHYLRSLGAEPGKTVKLVIGSHWHDDHVRGLAEIVATCAAARFVCAAALTSPEFITMVQRYNERPMAVSGSGVTEMARVLQCLRDTDRRPTYAIANRPVLALERAESALPASCTVTTLSPSDKQFELFLSEIASSIPQLRQTKRRAVPQRPNRVAVALSVVVGSEAVLLGSDLEETGDLQTGWSAIVGSAERPGTPASAFKLPHHGSKNGHFQQVWEKMLAAERCALLTPFVHGRLALPTRADVKRISDLADRAYATSRLTARAPVRRRSEVEKTIRETVGRIRLAEPKFGQVRLRKRLGSTEEWRVSLFGNACALDRVWQ